MSDDNVRMYGGRWRVVREIERGGQGIVYKVEDTSGPEPENVLLARFNDRGEVLDTIMARGATGDCRTVVHYAAEREVVRHRGDETASNTATQ